MPKNTLDIPYFKKRLETELKTLETELKSVGHRNPSNTKDWEASSGEVDINASDSADIADNIESYESNTAILKPLEIQYNDVKLALEKIKNNKYGVCEVSGKPIEVERLEANPAARTNIKHKEDKIY
jgi:RNA polymerase-binding transcription factor DksA